MAVDTIHKENDNAGFFFINIMSICPSNPQADMRFIIFNTSNDENAKNVGTFYY